MSYRQAAASDAKVVDADWKDERWGAEPSFKAPVAESSDKETATADAEYVSTLSTATQERGSASAQ